MSHDQRRVTGLDMFYWESEAVFTSSGQTRAVSPNLQETQNSPVPTSRETAKQRVGVDL